MNLYCYIYIILRCKIGWTFSYIIFGQSWFLTTWITNAIAYSLVSITNNLWNVVGPHTGKWSRQGEWLPPKLQAAKATLHKFIFKIWAIFVSLITTTLSGVYKYRLTRQSRHKSDPFKTAGITSSPAPA